MRKTEPPREEREDERKGQWWLGSIGEWQMQMSDIRTHLMNEMCMHVCGKENGKKEANGGAQYSQSCNYNQASSWSERTWSGWRCVRALRGNGTNNVDDERKISLVQWAVCSLSRLNGISSRSGHDRNVRKCETTMFFSDNKWCSVRFGVERSVDDIIASHNHHKSARSSHWANAIHTHQIFMFFTPFAQSFAPFFSISSPFGVFILTLSFACKIVYSIFALDCY